MLVEYLNRADVQAALNIIHPNEGQNGGVRTVKWQECSDSVFNEWPVADTFADTVKLYQVCAY